ncbi:MAG: M48 family metallopeptidase [Lachnospiraceae bacterium]|nr:M48 family metallopeptidase [Lachnospiraceae bacterium]
MTIPYEIIRSKRKTYGISIAPGGKVTVRIPLRGSERFAVSMVESKKNWIAASVLKLRQVEPYSSQKEKSPAQKRLETIYRNGAKEYIPKRVSYFARMLSVSYGTITIRDQKTRWGSCSSKGNLSFNWRLILAPPQVLDYVVVHELCHRKEMNHSKRFWELVESIIPDYAAHRKWLKDNGNQLSLTLPTPAADHSIHIFKDSDSQIDD